MSARDDLEKARERLSRLPKDEWNDEKERREAACPWRKALEQEADKDESVDLLKAIREELKAAKQEKGAWLTPMGALVVGADETLAVLATENPFSVREYWKRMEEVAMPMHLGLDAEPRTGSVCPVRGPDKEWATKYSSKIKPGEYQSDSVANEYIYSVGRAEAFCRALELARREFQKAERETLQDTMKLLALPGGGGPRPELRVTVDLWGFAERVIARLSRHWFAIPDGKYMRLGGEPKEPEDEKAYCPSDFVLFSRHVFRPDPDEHVKDQAAVRGEKVMQAAEKAIARRLEKGDAHPFLEYLRNKDEDIGVVARRAVGAIDGFVAANWGSFLVVARKWLEGPPTPGKRIVRVNLWRIQREHQRQMDHLRAEAANLAERLDEKEPLPRKSEHLRALENLLADSEPLLEEVIGVLKSEPVPAWLHRFAVNEVNLNGTTIRAGERVILHLGSAATDADNAAKAADILFGGRYKASPPRNYEANPQPTYLHACPGKDLAMGVLMGMLVGLLELKDVRRESPVTISFPPRGIGAPSSPPLPLVPPNPDDPRKLSVEDHRLWIGVLGFLLPVLAYLFAGVWPDHERLAWRWYPLRDVSEYFHTSAVSVFCGMLIAMFGFLITYRGYDRTDVWTARIAGVSGAVVACCPTLKSWEKKGQDHWWPEWSKYLHVFAAFVMFVCLIVLAVGLFRKSEDEKKKGLPRHERPIEKRFRDDLCLIAGLLMSAALAWLGVAFGSDKRFVGGLCYDLALVKGPAGAWMALGFMLSCALISIGLFRRSARKERDAAKKPLQHERVAIPLVVIAALAGGFGCMLALDWLQVLTGKIEETPLCKPSISGQGLDTLIMLVPEVLAIWAFALSWMVKSQHRRVNPWVDRLRRWLARHGWRYKPLPP